MSLNCLNSKKMNTSLNESITTHRNNTSLSKGDPHESSGKRNRNRQAWCEMDNYSEVALVPLEMPFLPSPTLLAGSSGCVESFLTSASNGSNHSNGVVNNASISPITFIHIYHMIANIGMYTINNKL